MSDIAELRAEIEKLQMRVAFQDQSIEDLNTTITEQWTHIDKIRQEISRLSAQLSEVEPRDDGTGAPPPHY